MAATTATKIATPAMITGGATIARIEKNLSLASCWISESELFEPAVIDGATS
jgi:hypothetical protein